MCVIVHEGARVCSYGHWYTAEWIRHRMIVSEAMLYIRVLGLDDGSKYPAKKCTKSAATTVSIHTKPEIHSDLLKYIHV